MTNKASYDEIGQLLQSGALAAAQLGNLPEKQEQEALAQSQEFAGYWLRYQQGNLNGDNHLLAPHREASPPTGKHYTSGLPSTFKWRVPSNIYQPYL